MRTMNPVVRAALDSGGVDRVEHYAELWQGTTRVATARVLGGQVSQDAAAAVRRTCDLTLAGWDGVVPETAWTGTDRRMGDGTFGSGVFGDYRRRYYRGLLLPLRTQVRPFTRYTVGDVTDVVAHGRFTVGDPEFTVTRSGLVQIRVSGWDLAGDVAMAGVLTPVQVEAGSTVGEAIVELLTAVMPGVDVFTPSTTVTVPHLVWLPGDGVDAWAEAQRLAASAGWVLFVDADGVVTAQEAPDPEAGEVLWAVDARRNVAGEPRMVPAGTQVVNTAVVVADTTGSTPVVAVVQDESGPYGTGTLGRVVSREFSATGATSYAEAHAAGVALLRTWSALTETVELPLAPSPWAEVDDLVSCRVTALELEAASYRVVRVDFPLDVTSPTVVSVARRIG